MMIMKGRSLMKISKTGGIEEMKKVKRMKGYLAGAMALCMTVSGLSVIPTTHVKAEAA